MHTRLILMRHAETARPDLIHGQESDVALGPTGLQQARLAGEALRRIAPSLLFSSGMLRARQTAAEIGVIRGLEPLVEESLHEQRMGLLSGQSRVSGLEAHRKCLERWKAGDLSASLPGGESFLEIRDRVVPTIQKIARDCAGRTGIVVAHGVVIRVLIVSLCGEVGLARLDQLGIDFTAGNDLRYDGETWQAVALNSPINQLAAADFESRSPG